MTDLDKIYGCILDKTYKNKTQFEIIISQIEDTDLAIGFIFDMLLKHVTYEVDKQSMLELMADTLGEMKPRDFIKECHNSFLEKIKKINEDSMVGNMFIVNALSALYTGTIVEFEKVVSECEGKEHLSKLKENLLEAELYEFIGIVDKYIG
jgi:hypothetical protein